MTFFSDRDIFIGIAVLVFLSIFLLLTVIRGSQLYQKAALFKLITFILHCLFLIPNNGGDCALFYDGGLESAASLRSFFLVGDISYFRETPFWEITGSNTDRMISLLGPILVLTNDSFVGASLVICAFGFMGQIFLHRGLRLGLAPCKKAEQFIDFGCLFLPSVVFWSAAMLKDPMGLFGLGLAVYGWKAFLYRRNLAKTILYVTVGVYACFLFRPQIAPCVLLAAMLAICLGSAGMTSSKRGLLFFGTLGICVVSLFIWTVIDATSDTSVSLLPAQIHENAMWYTDTNWGHVGSATAAGTWGALTLGAPFAIVNVLFRPFPWDVINPVMAVAALENLYIVWTVIFITKRSKLLWRFGSGTERMEFVFLATAVLSISLLVGASTLNLGSTSRYRIPALPMLFGAAALVAAMEARLGFGVKSDVRRSGLEGLRKTSKAMSR